MKKPQNLLSLLNNENNRFNNPFGNRFIEI